MAAFSSFLCAKQLNRHAKQWQPSNYVLQVLLLLQGAEDRNEFQTCALHSLIAHKSHSELALEVSGHNPTCRLAFSTFCTAPIDIATLYHHPHQALESVRIVD